MRKTRRLRLSSLLPLLVLVGGSLAACDKSDPNKVTELRIEDIVVGEGQGAANGQTIHVHYTGWLYKPSKEGGRGYKFDSSVDRKQPFSFRLGGRQVIQGWEKGMLGMKIGGKRVLIIPPDLAYGESGGGPIPANSTLIFDVERLDPATLGGR